MKRLTTDNPTDNISILLNFSYAKDERVFLRYVDGKSNVDLCEYIAGYADKYFCKGLTAADVMDGCCCAVECPECPAAIMTAIAIQAAELRGRLKMYEDAVDKGLIPPLTELPEEVE